MSTEPTNDQLAYQAAIARVIECSQAGDVAGAADAAQVVEAMFARLIEKTRAMLDTFSENPPDWLRDEALALDNAVTAATKPYTVSVLLMQGYGHSFGTLSQAFEYAAQEARNIDGQYAQDDSICEGIICEHVDGAAWTLVEENGLYSWQLDNDGVTQVATLQPGARIVSIAGECDDGDDGPRETGPNAIGTILELYPGCDDHYSVGFENGTSVLLTVDELADPKQYTLLD